MNIGATCKVGFFQMFGHGHAMNLITKEFIVDAFQISTSSTQVCQNICNLYNVIFSYIVKCGVFSVLFHLLALWEGQLSPSLA
jgi:hypothetical protein